MTSFSLILGGVSCAFCRHRRAPRGRADGSFAPTTEAHSLKIRLPAPHSQSVAVLPTSGNVIRAFTSLWRGRLAARTFEALRTRLCAQALAAIFPRQGTFSGFCNLRGAFSALRSLLLRSLVQHPEKSGRGVTQALFLAPAFLSVPVLHVSNRHQKDSRDHGKSTRKYG